MSATGLLLAIAVLAAGTWTMRAAGLWLRARTELPAGLDRVVTAAAVVLLTALVVTSAALAGGAPAGPARPAGVLVGGLLAWRRAPLPVVVVAAAAVAALLRLAGLP